MSYRNRGPTLSWSPATPQKLSSYHPDNPRRHGSQLSTALVLCLRCVLFRVPSLDCTPLNSEQHRKQHHLHLPIQHKPLSWVDWKKISPTMRQAQLGADVHPAAAISPHTSNTLTTTSLSPSPLQWKAVSMRAGQPIRRGRSTL